MKKLDATGLTCPAPVIMAKKAVSELPAEGGAVTIYVDNETACENLSKMCEGKGYECKIEKKKARRYAVIITVGKDRPQEKNMEIALPIFPSFQGSLVVAISRESMGSGSEELGKILIKGFIYSLTQLEMPPKTLLFFNGGVKLALEGATTLEDLKTLESKGVKIKICGTCVNYYNCKEQIAVGEIVNMYDITEAMSKGQPLINI